MPTETGRDMEQAASFQASETDPNKEKIQSKFKAFLKKYAKLVLPGALLFSSMASAEAQNPNLPNRADHTKISTADTGSVESRIPHIEKVGISQPEAIPAQPAQPVKVEGLPTRPEVPESTVQPAKVEGIPTRPEVQPAQPQPAKINIGHPEATATASVEQNTTDVTI